MKKEKLLRAMSLADEKYVDEAADAFKKKRNSSRVKIIIALAAVLSVIISLSLWLFIPLKDANADISRYRDSEYYEVIQKLHAAGYRAPRYKNNFERYVKGFFNFTKEEAAVDGADAAPEASLDMDMATNTTGSLSKYHEVTDNQVAGVIEADLIKRTDTHVFYLDGTTLRAFSIAGDSSAEVGSFDIESVTQRGFSLHYAEFYLSLDGKTLTLILPHSYGEDPFVLISALDVSDPSTMKPSKSFTVSGRLLSTRYTNGELLVMSSFSPELDYSRPECFVPSIGETAEDMKALAPDKIIAPDTLSSTSYTVVSRLDAQSLECKDSISLLSYSGDAYVCADTIFATRTFNERTEADDGIVTSGSRTEIVGVSYTGEKMALLGSVKVNGYIKDQYSLDEYKGILRVVTTVDDYSYKLDRRDDGVEIAYMTSTSRNGTNASLWCVDLSNWTISASVERFAPDGETVRSVRFDGKNAYVCTSIQLQDPVFFFDLSDISNITYVETGTIEGFSTSLVDFSDGYLLGIGVGGDGYLKIEVYEEKDGKVVSVCKYEPPLTMSSSLYKSYYIDRENGLVGLATVRYDSKSSRYEIREYTLLRFSGRALNVELRTELKGDDPSTKRGVYIDGYFYMFGENDFKVEEIELK